ncbi:glycoside hydrolase family 99-like domain-containing protein [Bacteroides sp. 224]|uniref:glycosyltransferase WbsX family protein n=1 Tax=Bacteroides sp. 224 TaxID=2302936 RepID=UPI0013D009E9|nr:glycoside hydrolase family 99-like domain-containing protein [Bacteroides sp. 224]NDV64971.1 lipopolysaccharide biosynthesis protein [Bacteroides sp. 224]
MNKPRLISFYLPQFYPTPENDEWWGKGFTEWTNVGKAQPLFKGHYQPKVPTDLGYYDLRIPEVRIEQAKLAADAGIEGFCYWHYWFSGYRLLDRVFEEVLETGKPDFPFCLCWANHSWYAKTWKADIADKLLIKQEYPGREDYINHFYALLPAFRDERYIRVDNKPLFAIFAPKDIPNVKEFICLWNELALKNGLSGIHFVAFTFFEEDIELFLKLGFDAVTYDCIKGIFDDRIFFSVCFRKLIKKILGIPRKYKYEEYTKYLLNHVDFKKKQLYPCVLPNFDHSPRSQKNGLILTNSTPEKWGELLGNVLMRMTENTKDSRHNILFIKAWNEWGEGNYLEPDLKYGNGFLNVMRDLMEEYR